MSEQLVGRIAAGIAAATCVGLYLEARGVTLGRARRPLATLVMLASIATYFHHLWGALVAAACSLAATLAAFGPRYHAEFASHIAMHASTPVSNHMSLRTLFSIGPETLQQDNEDVRAEGATLESRLGSHWHTPTHAVARGRLRRAASAANCSSMRSVVAKSTQPSVMLCP